MIGKEHIKDLVIKMQNIHIKEYFKEVYIFMKDLYRRLVRIIIYLEDQKS